MKSSLYRQVAGKEYFLGLLPLFFVFHGYTDQYPLVSLREITRLFGIYLFSFAVLSLVVFIFIRNWRKAAVYTFCVMCYYFFFGAVHDALKKYLPGIFITKYSFIIPLSFLLFIILFYVVKKSEKEFKRLTRFLNLLLIVLVLIDAGALSFKMAEANSKEAGSAGTTGLRCDTCPKPDIYLIIADEYAGNDALKDLFHFDNSPFETALRNRGFHIVQHARSNYNYTPYSVASLLSMNYLTGITKNSSDVYNRRLSYQTINDNELFRFLKKSGYSFKNFSLFDFADEPTQVNNAFILTREKLITAQTFFYRLKRDIRFNLVTRFKIRSEIENFTYNVRENNGILFDKTIAATKEKNSSPRFIYTHLMMPHYPYYFNKNGKPNSLELIIEGKQHRQDLYLEYLQYGNKKFIYLIDQILKNNATPPIIIFLGDHGFRSFISPVADKYHFMSLNAVYFPDKKYASFYDTASHVNLFRTILNTKFGQEYPLLEDSSILLNE